MIRLLRIEIVKNWTYPTFWIIVFLYFFLLGSLLFNLRDLIDNINFTISSEGVINTSLFPILKFPDIWQNISYLAGYLKFLLGIFIAISVTNEFTFNTLQQNIQQGMSAFEFIGSKLITIFILAALSTLFLFGTGLVIADYSSGEFNDALMGFDFILAYFVSIIFYLSFVIMISLWIRKTGMSIVLIILYPLVLEPIIRWFSPVFLRKFFPFYNLDHLIPLPFKKYIGTAVAGSVDLYYLGMVGIWTILFLVISFLILKKRDL